MRPGLRSGNETRFRLYTLHSESHDPRKMAVQLQEEHEEYRYPITQDLPEELKCPICLDILEEPQLTECCGHHLCKKCFDGVHTKRPKPDPNLHIQPEPACPMCKEVTGFKVVLDKNTNRKVGALKVECPNRQDGCKWHGEVSGMLKHLLSCEFSRQRCPNGCGEEKLLTKMDEHLQSECCKRNIECKYCSKIHKFEDLEIHWSTSCPSCPVPCPNGCKLANLLRKDEGTHLEVCPFQTVGCELAEIGCREKMYRKDLSSHMEKKTHDHLRMTCQFTVTLQRSLKAKDAQLALVEQKLEIKEQEVNEIRNSLHKMQIDFHQKLQYQSDKLLAKLKDGEAHVEKLLKQGNKQQKVESSLYSRVETLEMLIPVPPYYFTLTNYSLHKQGKTLWMCAPFSTSLGRYKMAVEVSANGEGTGKNTHVSVYVRIMRGEHDHQLKWPLRANITMQLISQLNDTHYELTTPIYNWERVADGVVGAGWGWDRFIVHDKLEFNQSRQTHYLKNDRLNFRVICVNEIA